MKKNQGTTVIIRTLLGTEVNVAKVTFDNVVENMFGVTDKGPVRRSIEEIVKLTNLQPNVVGGILRKKEQMDAELANRIERSK